MSKPAVSEPIAKPVVKLKGATAQPDVIGKCCMAMKEAKVSGRVIEAFVAEAGYATDFDELLELCRRYCEMR